MPTAGARSAASRITLTRALVALGAVLVGINVASAIWDARTDRDRTELRARCRAFLQRALQGRWRWHEMALRHVATPQHAQRRIQRRHCRGDGDREFRPALPHDRRR